VGKNCLRFAPNIARWLVRSETEERGVTQMTVRCPLDESNLGDELRLQPSHFAHLFSRDAGTPVGRLAVRQVDKWTIGNLQRHDLSVDLTPHHGRESGAHFSGESERIARSY
jgi:hypothetical protein